MNEFDRAWQALVEEDARLVAPARVEAAVMDAWFDRDRTSPCQVPSRTTWLVAASVAATAVMMGVLVFRAGEERPQMPGAEVLQLAPVSAPAAAWTAPPVEVTVAAPSFARAAQAEQPAIMTLAVDPVLDTESLHIVRVRMPRVALGTLGIMLFDPEASGLVDVDVLVGDDGLPRDIRRVKAVVSAEEEKELVQ